MHTCMAVVIRIGLELTVQSISVINLSLIPATKLENVYQMVITFYVSVLLATLESSANSQQQAVRIQ